jgi:hypothetical protein
MVVLLTRNFPDYRIEADTLQEAVQTVGVFFN